MLYDLNTMPRNEIHFLLIDLHEQKKGLTAELKRLELHCADMEGQGIWAPRSVINQNIALSNRVAELLEKHEL